MFLSNVPFVFRTYTSKRDSIVLAVFPAREKMIFYLK